MERIESKITAQGQVSVPARIRRRLGLTPGSKIEWCESGGEGGRSAGLEVLVAGHSRGGVRQTAGGQERSRHGRGGSGPGCDASMRAIDTNVLVRLIVRDEPAQFEKAESFVAQGAWVSQLVLAETVWVLESVYGFDRVQDRNPRRDACRARPVDLAGRGRDPRSAFGVRAEPVGRLYGLSHRRGGPQGGSPSGRHARSGNVPDRWRARGVNSTNRSRVRREA